MSKRIVVSTLAMICLVTLAARAAGPEVVGWRGNVTGLFPKSSAPLEWSTDKNVLWKTPTDSWSNAIPVVVGKRVFICVEPTTLMCLDADTGKVLWKKANNIIDTMSPAEQAEAKEFSKKAEPLRAKIKKLDAEDAAVRKSGNRKDPEVRKKRRAIRNEKNALFAQVRKLDKCTRPRTHGVNGYSSPTPVTDGRNVFVLFGTGVAACYDMDGNRQWTKFVQAPKHGWGHSASPILAGGKLIVAVLDVIALDAAKGTEAWRVESKAHWGTPIADKIGSEDVVFSTNGEVIRVSDGKLLASEVSGVEYCAPVVIDGIVYYVENGGKAIKLPAASNDAKFKMLWKTKPKRDRYYASPIIHKGLIYAVTRVGDFSIIDAGSGEVIFTKKIKDMGKGQFYPSLVLSGKHVLLSIDNGTTAVLEPGREYKEVGRNKLEPFRTTPVIVGGRMYIRTLKHIYCIAKK